MFHEVITHSADQTEDLGIRLGRNAHPGTIIVLEGPLGSGKTTITKGIAKGLGIEEIVTSPSFTIMAEYEGPIPMVHVDLYRTGSDEELELLGLREKLATDSVCVIEWGEKAEAFVPAGGIRIRLEILADGARKIVLRGTSL